MKITSLVYLFIVLTIIKKSCGAATHKHTHGGSKERTEDGSYSPRDAHHHDSDGEHHSEFDHEAILGSVKEAEEFDSLSPEESKKRLATLVKKMDLNSDYYITRNELNAWILRSFKMLSEEEGSERFTEVDENNDDRVTWDEYVKDSYGFSSEEESGEKDFIEPAYSKDEQKMMSDDREMFNASDINKDGILTHDEFLMFISPEEHPTMIPVILEQTLRDKDKNGDGKIDFQEFIGEAAKHQDKEWLVTEKEKFDSEHDKDGDGFLNRNEILSWAVPSNE